MDRLNENFAKDTKPSQRDVSNAFWSACHGGQLQSARYLLARGAELNWVEHDLLTPLDAAVRNGHEEVIAWLRGEGRVSQKERSM